LEPDWPSEFSGTILQRYIFGKRQGNLLLDMFGMLVLDRYVLLFPLTSNRDAGLVLSSYIASLLNLKTSSLPRLPILETSILSRGLNILELGAGCGIVGITLLHTLPPPTQILLTDLPEATEILTHNLSPSILEQSPSNSSKISHQVLDWSLALPPNVATTAWDLVFVADCTYNPDVVPDLVATLGRVADGNREVKVVVAMKVRHESEMVFFDLMKEKGFGVSEKTVLPLPVLGGEEEEIQVFVFGYGER
jgi:predicted nicotinamide N-methyase